MDALWIGRRRAHTHTNGDRGECDWADGEGVKKEDWQLDRNSVKKESEARKAERKPGEDGPPGKRWRQIFGTVPKVPLSLSPGCLFIRGQTKYAIMRWRNLKETAEATAYRQMKATQPHAGPVNQFSTSILSSFLPLSEIKAAREEPSWARAGRLNLSKKPSKPSFPHLLPTGWFPSGTNYRKDGLLA